MSYLSRSTLFHPDSGCERAWPPGVAASWPWPFPPGSEAPPIPINVLKTGLYRIPLLRALFVSLPWTSDDMLAVIPSVSLWIIVLFGCGGSARRQADDPDAEESWSESVSRARCASRCLSLHSVAALSTPLQVGTHELVHPTYSAFFRSSVSQAVRNQLTKSHSIQ